MRASTRGRAGTIAQPVVVDTSTSLRQRRGFWNAICWASAPPQEIPSTSNRLVGPARLTELGEPVDAGGQTSGPRPLVLPQAPSECAPRPAHGAYRLTYTTRRWLIQASQTERCSVKGQACG
jgi:hypothetical protein